ncbi:hypothetical protein GSI_15120 [Ganoderma sinense ZZ0214-1]|uniref:Uncharacterized protein n=1 Tax=Ganoderma sinense ZZ0214-1 TaxID=1077348 RepID=A0A2G8RLP5_9APHY|nr:hypothetical protein GSI_15120 [Ganoderma sinense ZZ0214-1]
MPLRWIGITIGIADEWKAEEEELYCHTYLGEINVNVSGKKGSAKRNAEGAPVGLAPEVDMYHSWGLSSALSPSVHNSVVNALITVVPADGAAYFTRRTVSLVPTFLSVLLRSTPMSIT